MNLLLEELKSNLLLNATINTAANNTSGYVNFDNARRAMLAVDIACAAGMVKDKTVTVDLMEAKDAGGTGAQPMIAGGVVAKALIDSIEVTTSTDGIQVGDTIEINGKVFTRKAADNAKKGEFKDDDGLVAAIEYHLPKLSAVKGTNAVTVTAAEAGGPTVSLVETIVTSTGTPWAPAGITTKLQMLLEVNSEQLSKGFTHVAAKVTSAAAQDIVATVTAIRGVPMHLPVYQPIAGKGVV